jgi:hypothetical protein
MSTVKVMRKRSDLNAALIRISRLAVSALENGTDRPGGYYSQGGRSMSGLSAVDGRMVRK